MLPNLICHATFLNCFEKIVLWGWWCGSIIIKACYAQKKWPNKSGLTTTGKVFFQVTQKRQNLCPGEIYQYVRKLFANIENSFCRISSESSGWVGNACSGASSSQMLRDVSGTEKIQRTKKKLRNMKIVK